MGFQLWSAYWEKCSLLFKGDPLSKAQVQIFLPCMTPDAVQILSFKLFILLHFLDCFWSVSHLQFYYQGWWPREELKTPDGIAFRIIKNTNPSFTTLR